ncbi:MAG: hypothetical protein H7833_12840 [Magnetococcus sp. DMHC-1]|nr:alpha/beta fold hydrolase [Magnetococcales bacterium]
MKNIRILWLSRVLLATLLWVAVPARADVLVLVHGYFSDDRAWDQSGVTAALQMAGWRDGGGVSTQGGTIQERIQKPVPGRHTYYRADLPSEAPIDLQARLLRRVVERLFAGHPHEKRFLVGHSAGGVVARLLMVSHPDLAIHLLVTIAAPHLGTDKAEVALLVGSTPLSMMAPMLGGDTLNRSQRLYADLVREQPGNFLYRLNRRPHPRARYVSIVRKVGAALSGDLTVPSWSQDMQNIAALRGRQTETMAVVAGHALERVDGQALVQILRKF